MRKVESFKDLIEKLQELHRQRYILHRTENGADLIYLSDHRPYTILSAVFINMDMEVTVYNDERIVPSSSYNHVMPTSKVTMIYQVSNLLAFAKNLDLKKPAAEEQFKANIFKLINSFLLESRRRRRRRLKRYPLQVRHKQDWGRGFILLLPQTAALPGSDAGSDVIKPASSFVIQNRQTSCSMWCPMYRARC